MNKITLYVIVVAVLIVLVGGGFFVYNSLVYRTAISDFDLKASITDAAGIAPNSHFILKTTASLTPQVIKKYFSIVPAVDFSVKTVAAQQNTFEIVPETQLDTNKVYTIKVDKGPLASRDFSWAYQVKAPFQIISSIPKDKGIDVPTNTGIEINFNRDNIQNPEKFIDISPSVSGTFSVVNNTVRFVPNSPLGERSIYTVTVRAGLGAQDTTDVLASSTVIQFQTSEAFGKSHEPTAYFSRDFTEFKPGSDILLGVGAYNISSIPVTVYRLDSAQALIDSVAKAQGDTSWARYYKNLDSLFTDNQKVFSGTLPVATSNYLSTIKLPQDLPAGYYAIIITSKGRTNDISWFQVNPAASFVAFSSVKSLVWLKDSGSGNTIANAPILYNGKKIGQTGSDGAATVDTPSDLIRKPTDPYYYFGTSRKFLVADIPTGALVIPVEGEYGYATALNPRDAWWNYVSLNKNIYLPTDTVRFWTIAKPRDGASINGDVTVKLTSQYWNGEESQATTYAETTVKPSEYNAVTGELSFANLRPGAYDLTFSQGDQTIIQKMVEVNAYIKPAYKITLTPDKQALFAGESVTYNLKAEFFDGTPVANTSFSYSAYGIGNRDSNGTLKVNARGEGSFTVNTEYNDRGYWPDVLGVTVHPTGAEEGQIETNSAVFVFGPHVNTTINQKQTSSNVTFNVKTRSVVLSATPRGEPYWDPEEYLGNPVVNASTHIDVFEEIYIKTKTGTGYDPINKITYPIYDYHTEDRPISNQIINSDQNGLSQFVFALEKDKTYKFTFTTYDSTGRADIDTRYAYGGWGDIGYQEDSSYILNNPDADKKYNIGDPINLQLQAFSGILPPSGSGNYIFLTVRNGVITYKIQDSPQYTGTFTNEDIPNVGVWAGWFAGGRFHNTYPQNLSFNANSRRLTITVTKDKQTYKPGDTVKLDIKVKDKSGNPVKAEVNLSALDEAVFSINPSETDIINTLYQDIFSQVVIRTSNTPPYGGGGAEKGGGGEGSPRSNIQEMAVYKSITTDASGSAHVEFKLPDNITSWRLTSQAVTKDLLAGKDVSFIPVTLPFFVEATLNNTYLAGDQLTLRLRTFGALADRNGISYSVEGSTLPFKKADGVGGNAIEIPLGSLSSGNHQLTIRAKAGDASDAITRNLNVLDSYFTKNVSQFYEGKPGVKITSDAIGYTTLAFGSYGRGQLYNQLKSLSYQWGVRLDQKGAKLIARNLLNTYFGEKNEAPDLQASKYQSYVGGLQLLPYSSDDLELSALSAHLFDTSIFDTQSLKNYFYQSLSDKKADISRIARALYGLAAYGEPVLTKIEHIKNDKALNIKDKVFIALALDSLGAKEEARTYYKQAIKPYIQMQSSYAYVEGLQPDDTITTTALAAALAASLEEPETGALALYVDQNYPHETLDTFQQLLYVKAAIDKLDPADVGFTYQIGSKTVSKTLKNGEIYEVTLSPQDLAALKITDVKGKLGVVASYEKSSSPQSIVKDPNLTLTRLYEVNGVQTKQFNEGDAVIVRLNPQFGKNALNSVYQIIDYLPSGLRPLDQESVRYYGNTNYDGRIYPVEINDQKVTFIVSKNVTMPIYYFARVVSKGTYKADPALLQSLKSLDSATISDADSITIK